MPLFPPGPCLCSCGSSSFLGCCPGMWDLWPVWRTVGVACQEQGAAMLRAVFAFWCSSVLQRKRSDGGDIETQESYPLARGSYWWAELGFGSRNLRSLSLDSPDPGGPFLSLLRSLSELPLEALLRVTTWAGITGGQGAFAHNLPTPVQMF